MKVQTLQELPPDFFAPNPENPNELISKDSAKLASLSINGKTPIEAILGLLSTVLKGIDSDKTFYIGTSSIKSDGNGSAATLVFGVSGTLDVQSKFAPVVPTESAAG